MQVERTIHTLAGVILLLLIVVLLLNFAAKPAPRAYSPDGETSTIAHAPGAPAIEPEPAWVDPETNQMEKNIHDLVNQQRKLNGLQDLAWNDSIAAVARQHSQDLAEENIPLTERSLLCYYPLIHHLGFSFGSHVGERLENHSIYNFLASGENLILVSTWDGRRTYGATEADCEEYDKYNVENVSEELERRLELANKTKKVSWQFHYLSQEDLEASIINGWMNSPEHRDNILGNYTDAGVGIAKVNDFYIVTQVFIQKIDCGYPGAQCCVNEDYLFCYEPTECMGGVCLIPEQN